MTQQKRQIYEFDNCRLDVGERLLLRDGQAVTLPAKAFDLLTVLVENSGRLVEKELLYERVWADQVVEESNLTVQMSAIRKALGENKQNPRYIMTVAGHGYRFVADVVTAREEPEVVIETETLSRIVIESEVEGYDLGVPGLARAFEPSQQNLLETRTHSAVQVSARSEPSWLTRRRIALYAALLVLFVGVIAAFWLYQSRTRNRRVSGSPQTPQLKFRRFTTQGGVPVRVAISPDGKNLIYWQRFNGKLTLWLGQVETNTSVLLSQQQDLFFEHPVFTPDGSNIYFNLSGGNRVQPMLARMPILGGAITELIPLSSPVTFSPDGKRMAFLRREGEATETSLIIADADGQNQSKLLSRTRPESFSNEGLSWSPDGKRIAFSAINPSRQEEIAEVSVADGSVRRIGNRNWAGVFNLIWLPDGSNLLVVARENVGERQRQLWLLPYPDGEAHRITNDLNIFLLSGLSISADGKLAVLQGHYSPEIWIAPNGDTKRARRVLQGVAPRYEGVDGLAWTPDGRLLYTAYIGDSLVIWSINSDGGDLRQLTPTKSNTSDSNLCVTADGRYVVFQSNRSGAIEIWRVNSDGSDMKQLTTGGNNSSPSLSPDGQWIVYNTAHDGKATVARIPIDGGESVQVADLSASWSQVSPDGNYIACMVPSSRRLLVIPFAGGEPVKSFPLAETAIRGPRMRWAPDSKSILYRDDPQGVLRQSLNEEVARPIKGFEEIQLRNLAWSFDGKNLAYTHGPNVQEIILIENFK